MKKKVAYVQDLEQNESSNKNLRLIFGDTHLSEVMLDFTNTHLSEVKVVSLHRLGSELEIF